MVPVSSIQMTYSAAATKLMLHVAKLFSIIAKVTGCIRVKELDIADSKFL